MWGLVAVKGTTDFSGLKDRIVGYVDILGYSRLVCNQNTVDSFYMELTEAINDTMQNLENNHFLNVTIVLYTDNILIIGNNPKDSCSFKVSFVTVLMATNYIQKLLLIKYKILTRGAIAIGRLSYESNLLYGPLMVTLNELEKEAKYPRIIVHRSITDFIENSNPEDQMSKVCNNAHHFFFNDHFGQTCLNYLGFNMPCSSVKTYPFGLYPTSDEISRHKEAILSIIDKHKKNKSDMKIEEWEKIRKKHSWIIHYHNDFCLANNIIDCMIDVNVYDYN